MLVALRTVELLALLTVAGLPVSLMLLEGIDKTFGSHARFLLAPLTGLACLALLSGLHYAFGLPVSQIVGPFWLGVIGLWLAVLGTVRSWPKVPFTSAMGKHSASAWLGWACVLAGGLLVLVTYLWPFLNNGQLVFWHYAGTDGYQYMRTAEFVGDAGTGQNPTVGTYDAASGFVLDELRHFHAAVLVEKPATMGVLAGLAALLGLLPHETFSPLTIAATLMLYISLLNFARWIPLHLMPSALFATFGALGMVAWMMGTYTFLGNQLALLFFPLLLPLGRPPSVRVAIYAGGLLAALTLVFPDGILVAIGLVAPYVVFSAWQAFRSRTVRRLGLRLALAIAVWMLPMLAFGRVLLATLVLRLGNVLASGAADRAPSSGLAVHPLESFNWLWPAFNLNVLPPEPLRLDQLGPLLLLGAACLGYAVSCVRSRRTDFVFYGLLSLTLLLLVGTVGGIFHSDYEMFRALAVLFFVPLAVVFSLPGRFGGVFQSRPRQLAATGLVAVAMLPILMRYAANDRYQFDLAYSQHSADAQYTSDDIRTRQYAERVLGSQTLVLSSETPSLTALANVLMLFSSTKLGVPNAFYKFVFFPDTINVPVKDTIPPQDNEQYASSIVLRNTRYGDIFDPSQTHRPIYASEDFSFFDNDLIPFFDNDTFPVVNPFPLAFLEPRQMAVARTLSQRTAVPFFSRADRQIDVELTFDAADPPESVNLQFDGGSTQAATVDPNGVLRISGLYCAAGLRTLTLGPLPAAARVTSMRLLPQS